MLSARTLPNGRVVVTESPSAAATGGETGDDDLATARVLSAWPTSESATVPTRKLSGMAANLGQRTAALPVQARAFTTLELAKRSGSMPNEARHTGCPTAAH